MSAAHDAHGPTAHAHHDHDHFDGEPAHELSPGEPRTPGWLPAVGLALFTCAAVWMLVSGDSKESSAPAPDTKPAAVAPPPEGTAAAAPAPRPRPPQGEPQPAGTAMRKLSPQQVEDLKKRIEEARQKGVLQRPAAPGK